jgi:hypothetical protein
MKPIRLLQSIRTIFLISLTLFFLPRPAASEPEILGWLEGAYLQPWGVRVRARLDSGALTSAMHAENIKVFKKNGADWVRFHFPFGRREGYDHGFDIERPLVRESRVKQRTGGLQQRYVINLDVCISGKTGSIELSLVNRLTFNYPIILGRAALAGRYLIDPGQTFLGNRTCPRKLIRSVPRARNDS